VTGRTSPSRTAPARRLLFRPLRAVVQWPLERIDPSPALLARRTAGGELPGLVAVAVYRRALAPVLAELVGQLPAGTRVALWALDEPVPALAAHTVGSGPGERLPLLNRLVEEAAPGVDDWVLVSDDDVRFTRGSPAALLRAAARLGLDLAQPAHTWSSEVSHRFTRRRALVLARTTRFVEQGPLALFGPRAVARLLPFREDVPWPGWGIEALWSRARDDGVTLGIVDGVTMRHVQRVNASRYSWRDAQRHEAALLTEAGFPSIASLHVDEARWRAWQEAPPAGFPRGRS
jgi:hypothetical protein